MPPPISIIMNMNAYSDKMRHVYGWLLLTPAAILLLSFTHFPTFATIYDSLFSKGTVIRPSKFIGPANYEFMLEDPIFWKVLGNNLWFALGTIPTSIALAIATQVRAEGNKSSLNLSRNKATQSSAEKRNVWRKT